MWSSFFNKANSEILAREREPNVCKATPERDSRWQIALSMSCRSSSFRQRRWLTNNASGVNGCGADVEGVSRDSEFENAWKIVSARNCAFVTSTIMVVLPEWKQ